MGNGIFRMRLGKNYKWKFEVESICIDRGIMRLMQIGAKLMHEQAMGNPIHKSTTSNWEELIIFFFLIYFVINGNGCIKVEKFNLENFHEVL